VRDVSTTQDVCRFYSYLVTLKKPEVVVEFGSAFGVSGMHWLIALEANGAGTLYSFEPNTIWFDIARSNFAQISDRAQIFNSTFEEGYPSVPHGIDLAFIDAIHTGDFVRSLLSLILEKASPGCLIIFDDINFSDDMRECWTQIAQDPRYAAVWDIDGRAGMVETRLPHPA
jgi:predicted O-methyltransferase YrrM